jgi:hypothetical protein
LADVLPEVTELFIALEDKFHPLQVASIVTPKLEFVKEQASLAQYIEPVKQLAFVRVLQQVCCVEYPCYQRIKICLFAYAQLLF